MRITPVAAGAALAVAGGVAFTSVVRPWYSRWGATDAEIDRVMPLDERIPDPTMSTTMAITINARPEAIWPWLVQIGEPPRAGYYSYTWIEKMVGLDVQNAGRILPEFQTVEVGQALDRNGTMIVQAVDPGHSLVLGPPPSVDYLQCTWAFALYPITARSTRLVTRVRARFCYGDIMRGTPVYTWPTWLLIDPGAFIMERKMLHEIKRLAESSQLTPMPARSHSIAQSLEWKPAQRSARPFRGDPGGAYHRERSGQWHLPRQKSDKSGSSRQSRWMASA